MNNNIKYQKNNSFSDKKKQFILLIILLLTPLPQLLIDIYLPGLPAIQNYFHTTAAFAQISLTVYLVCYSVSMVVFGISSDIYGRKVSYLTGLCICFVGLFMAAFSDSILLFLFGRAIQGLGVGAAASIIVPTCIDVFEGKKLLHTILYVNIAYAVAPIVAPYLGGAILAFSKWQTIFILVLVYTGFLVVLIKLFLPETNYKITGKLSFSKILNDSRRLFRSFNFLILLIVISCPWGFVIAFNVLGPFILQKNYGISPYHYGEITLVMGFANVLGVIFAKISLRYWNMERIISIGMGYFFIVSICFLSSYFLGFLALKQIIVFCFILLVTSGIVFGSLLLLALQDFDDISGLAFAVFLSLVNVICALISYVLTLFSPSVKEMPITSFILAGIGLFFWIYFLKKNKLNQQPL